MNPDPPGSSDEDEVLTFFDRIERSLERLQKYLGDSYRGSRLLFPAPPGAGVEGNQGIPGAPLGISGSVHPHLTSPGARRGPPGDPGHDPRRAGGGDLSLRRGESAGDAGLGRAWRLCVAVRVPAPDWKMYEERKRRRAAQAGPQLVCGKCFTTHKGPAAPAICSYCKEKWTDVEV